METITKTKEVSVSDDVYLKICRDFKTEIKENKKEIEKLNELDYEYNKKIIHVEKLIDIIDEYTDKKVIKKKTENVIIAYYGDPIVTIKLCLEALLNSQIVNLIIDDMCLGVNKLIVELYKEVLRDFKIFDIVSLNNYESKDNLEELSKNVTKIYCLGSKNLYAVCKQMQDIEIQYVPYNIIDIYCEDEEYYDFGKEIFNYCFENSIEAEVYDGEEMSFDEMINTINNYGEKYCSVILTKNDNYIRRFKKEVKSKLVYVNENPFTDEFMKLPEIF